MRDLGTLDGANCAYAFSVNAQEQVVGNSGAGCANSAFLWEDGGPMVDLSTLISPNPGFPQLNVISINDRGEIAGIGVDASDNTHSVLLIPCDENHPGIEGCDYSLVDAATAAEVQPPQITTEFASASSRTMPFPLGITSRVRSPWPGHGTPKPATHFSVSAPGEAAIGSAFSFTVTALSSSNTVATGYSGTVHFTSSDGQAVLPANSTLTNGVGNFMATLNTAGAQTITVTDAARPSITGASSAINIAANPSQVTVTISVSAGPPPAPRGSVGLIWSSTNATSCSASASPNVSNWSGSEPTSGSAVVPRTPQGESIKYTLTCTGATGSASASVTVNAPCIVGPCRFGLNGGIEHSFFLT
jgi:probable HAF family extracellular repeat protein